MPRTRSNGIQRTRKEYVAQTRLSDEIVSAMENAGKVKLTSAIRSEIETYLQDYEFLRYYEKCEAGRLIRNEIEQMGRALQVVIHTAKKLDRLQGHGHLWTYIAGEADVDALAELERLARVKDLARTLAHAIAGARSKKSVDHGMPHLLFRLEAAYKAAGGEATYVTNADGQRGGEFVRFCDEALGALPRKLFDGHRPPSIGARWERLYRERKNPAARRRTTRDRIWVGKATPALLVPAHYETLPSSPTIDD